MIFFGFFSSIFIVTFLRYIQSKRAFCFIIAFEFSTMKSLAILVVALAACTMVNGLFFTRLRVTQDVTLERGSRNFNYLRYLIVGTHPGYPLKRSLLKFHPLQVRACDRIRGAYLFLYYAYAHKASFMSHAQAPTFPRRIVAHQVLKSWSETQATSTRRYYGANWSQPWLNLGRDAVAYPTSYGVTISPPRSRPGFYSIDVTSAVRSWKSGRPNYGLLLRAVNEHRQGKDFRFYSKSERNASRHPYILVLCEKNNGFGGGRGKPLGGGRIGPAV
jgi:hypothetical protein